MMKEYSNETLRLQKELKDLLNEVGWSERDLARELCDDNASRGIPECDIDEDKEYEKIKKQLSRPTTKAHLLNQHIQFILAHRDIKKKQLRRMPSTDLTRFSENEKNLLANIAKISAQFFEEENV